MIVQAGIPKVGMARVVPTPPKAEVKSRPPRRPCSRKRCKKPIQLCNLTMPITSKAHGKPMQKLAIYFNRSSKERAPMRINVNLKPSYVLELKKQSICIIG